MYSILTNAVNTVHFDSVTGEMQVNCNQSLHSALQLQKSCLNFVIQIQNGVK